VSGLEIAFVDGTRAALLDEGVRLGKPGLSPAGRSVQAEPYRSVEEHEKHILKTVGSGNWYVSEFDEFRFSRETLELASFLLHVPERTVAASSALQRCDTAPVVGWLLRHPAQYLAPCWEQPSPGGDDPRIDRLLVDYLDVVEAGRLGGLEDGDPAASADRDVSGLA
jgi:hypothetical protein